MDNYNILLSGGEDGSLRAWDLNQIISNGMSPKNPWDLDDFKCVQAKEPNQTHIKKFDEGILCLEYQPHLQQVATGGADGKILLWSLGRCI